MTTPSQPQRSAYYRVLYYRFTNGERVNLAVVVFGKGFPRTWQTLTDYTRAAAFIGESVENVESLVTDRFDFFSSWTDDELKTKHCHYMSCTQLDAYAPTMIVGETDADAVQWIADIFLRGPEE